MTIQITKKIVGFNAQMKQETPEPIKTEPSVNEAPVEMPISNINYGIDVDAPSQLAESPDVLPEMNAIFEQEATESGSIEDIFSSIKAKASEESLDKMESLSEFTTNEQEILPNSLELVNEVESEKFADILSDANKAEQEIAFDSLSLDEENEIELEQSDDVLIDFNKEGQEIAFDNLENVSDAELEKFADALAELTKETPQIINTSAQPFTKGHAKEESIDTLELDDSGLDHLEEVSQKSSPLFEEANVRESFTAESIANVNVIDYEENDLPLPETTYSLLNKKENNDRKTNDIASIVNNEQLKTAMQNMAAINKNEMHELIERPEMLIGSTYKVKTPLSEHAMYITINDMILNEGTDQETRQPFEVFINSKSMDHFQWIVALTRIISAVFRKGGDITFLVEELHSVFDPKGGYFKSGGQYMPSLVAEIGDVIERHLKMIGIIQPPKKDPAIAQMIEEKRTQIEAKKIDTQHVQASDFPKGAILCGKCLVNAVILMDGCMTCLNCGDSKCG